MYMLDTNALIMAARHPDWDIARKIKHRNRVAITQILLGIKIISFDENAAAHFGNIFFDLEERRMRIGDRDMLIAGHARSLGCTLVTHNTREFERVSGLRIEDWYSEKTS